MIKYHKIKYFNMKDIDFTKAFDHICVTKNILDEDIELMYKNIEIDGIKYIPIEYLGEGYFTDERYFDNNITKGSCLDNTEISNVNMIKLDKNIYSLSSFAADNSIVITIPEYLYSYMEKSNQYYLHTELKTVVHNSSKVRGKTVTTISKMLSLSDTYKNDNIINTDVENADKSTCINLEMLNKSFLCPDCLQHFTPESISLNIKINENDSKKLSKDSIKWYYNTIESLHDIYHETPYGSRCTEDVFVAVDTDILDLILKLNKHNLPTRFCCSGNPKTHSGEGIKDGYIMFEFLENVNHNLFYLCKYTTLNDLYYGKIYVDKSCEPSERVTIRWNEFDKNLLDLFINHIINLWERE